MLPPGQAAPELPVTGLLSLTKRANGIPLITVEYHSVPFITIGPFNDTPAGLSGTLNGHLRYHPIPLNGAKNPKNHHNQYDTIQILLAIIPRRTIQIPFI